MPARDVVSWGKLILGRDDREAYLRRFERLRYNAADVEAVRAFNDHMAGVDALQSIIVPIGDGLWVGVKR